MKYYLQTFNYFGVFLEGQFVLGITLFTTSNTTLWCRYMKNFQQVKTQAAQSRKVNNYKDLYGNLDNRLKKIFTHKSSQ